MVKFLSSSLTVLVLTLAVVKAQTTATIDIKNYPAVNQIPPVNSPEVQAWLKEL
ncbi:hypothetical protein BGZ97_004529, partial [Linnemannia gamsii]